MVSNVGTSGWAQTTANNTANAQSANLKSSRTHQPATLPAGGANDPTKPPANGAAQLPAEGGSSSAVSISSEAKKLAAAQAVTQTPVAVAAVSDNAQVDGVALAVYSAQNAQNLIETYQNASVPGQESSGGSINIYS